MIWLMRPFVWLCRIGHCRGFGIQSPTDYWVVRYVINEHWPYYKYESLGKEDNWLSRKLGRLYFRLSNWLQPSVIESDHYQNYLKAGCNKAVFGDSSELICLSLENDYHDRLSNIYNKVNEATVLVVEDIWKDMTFWQEIVSDERTGITFDLYYCGIVMFDKNRHKQIYIVNF